MKAFFNVKTLEQVFSLKGEFAALGLETIDVGSACFRILASDLTAPRDLPGFRRSCMDGYAVQAASTFGASESSPAWLEISPTISMGQVPDFVLAPGQAAPISTGGMLPQGADAVVMVEHTEAVDESSVEIYKSVAPLQHVIDAAEDFAQNQTVLPAGTFLRPQETGLAAGLGFSHLEVHKKPRVGIISTGDEIVPITQEPGPGKIRDINSYTLAGFMEQAHAQPVCYGIVKDDPGALKRACERALEETDMVMISGGSSVGVRDFTLEVLSGLPDTKVLVHGMSISPGKPTLLARSGSKPVWGLPGQVVSAMVVVKIVVLPFLHQIQGHKTRVNPIRIPAKLTRNVSSAQGRRDFVRVLLENDQGQMLARPVLGKSGLIRTMIHADGLLEIPDHVEGLEQDTRVDVILL